MQEKNSIWDFVGLTVLVWDSLCRYLRRYRYVVMVRVPMTSFDRGRVRHIVCVRIVCHMSDDVSSSNSVIVLLQGLSVWRYLRRNLVGTGNFHLMGVEFSVDSLLRAR